MAGSKKRESRSVTFRDLLRREWTSVFERDSHSLSLYWTVQEYASEYA